MTALAYKAGAPASAVRLPSGRVWLPPGPVTARYLLDDHRVSGIVGPVGGGKTLTSLVKHVYKARKQRPSPIDGVRYYKMTVVRDTYRNLNRTTLRTWLRWFPKSMGTFRGGGTSEPSIHHMRINFGDGHPVDFQAEFMAIGDNDIKDVLDGYEPTAFHLEEADGLHRDVFNYARTRWGRYPEEIHGGPSWYGLTLASNTNDTEHWLYDQFIENPDDTHRLFVQPGGLETNAENLHHLPGGRAYYEEMARELPDWMVAIKVHVKWVAPRHGQPVYIEYNDPVHCASQPLKVDPRLHTVIGLDSDLRPAASFNQRAPNGQWRTVAELADPDGRACGPYQFADRLNQVLRARFPGIPPKQFEAFVDPSAFYGADSSSDDIRDQMHWAQKVASKTGLRIRPAARDNSINRRLDAVREPLTQLIDGHAPGLLICPTCKITRKGLQAAYCYERSPNGLIAEKPTKAHPVSDVLNALEYALLGGGERQEVEGRRRERYGGTMNAYANEGY